MAFVKMKPPAGVTVGLGADGKQYYVSDRGFANVDSGSVTKLTNEGWSSVTDSAPGKQLENVKAEVDPVTGGIGFSVGGRVVLKNLNTGTGIGMSGPSPGNISAAGGDFSFAAQIPAAGKFYAAKTVYMNYGAVSQDLTRSCAGVTSQSGVSPSAVNLTDWITSPLTLPAAVGTGANRVPGIAIGPIIYMSSIERTDGGVSPLLHRRDYFASTSAQFTYNAGSRAALIAAGVEHGFGVDSGDAVTTKTQDMPTPVTGAWAVPSFTIFYYGNSTTTIFDIGDSLVRGQTDAGEEVNVGYSIGQRVAVSKNLGCVSMAFGGQGYAATYAIAKAILATDDNKKILIIRACSPNDGASVAAIDKSWAQFLDIVETARKLSIRVIALTTGPANSFGTDNENIRASNTRLLALSALVDVVDASAIIADPSNPNIIRPQHDAGDGLHYTDACYAAISAAVTAII